MREEDAAAAAAAGSAPPIDFDLLLFRLQQLNGLAGDGKSRVVSKDGANQLTSEPLGGRLSLTLFKDGLMLRRGPFRPYAREATGSFVQDVLDGYFPFELKDRCVELKVGEVPCSCWRVHLTPPPHSLFLPPHNHSLAHLRPAATLMAWCLTSSTRPRRPS